ncbi:MAG: hypothetical protein AAFQ94_20280 [Bacteroidota bacterium]
MYLKLLLSLVLAILVSSTVSAQLLISEVLFAPGGSDDSNEFFEISGTANSTIAANTYLVFIEGDSDDPGDVNMAFDLSGQTFGSNGYLVFTLTGNSYSTAAGANEITSTTANWQGLSQTIGTSSNIEDLSETILLVTTSSAITGTSDDIDADDDGEIDISGWTIHDSISLLDNDDANEYGYGSIIYTNNSEGTIHPAASTVITVDFNGGYVSRIGQSTGSTNNDWFYASTSNAPADINSSSSDQAFSDETVTEVGGPSYVFSAVTYTGTEVLTNVDKTQNLAISADVSTSDDLECHNLVINSGETFTIENSGSIKVYGSLTIDGTMIVESGGTLWTFGGKDAEAATFERNTTYADGRYSFVGSPVASNASITGSDLGNIVFSYDETADYGTDGIARWKNAASDQLAVGVGYAQAFQEVISFTGVANSGTITVDVTHTTGAATLSANRGWNLVSNPYPAAIEADELLQLAGAGSNDNTNDQVIDGAIYLWDDGGSDEARGDNGDYLTWNAVGEVFGPNATTKGFQGQIRSMQGFFVRMTNAGTGTIEFNEDMRATGDNNDGRFFKEVPQQTIRLSLSSADGFYNQILIGYRSDATEGKDRSFDAMKLIGNDDLQFYSYIDGEKYAIQGLPDETAMTTELGFDAGTSGEYTLTVEVIEGMDSDVQFYMMDKLTNEVYDLSQISEFTFSASAGTDQNRFVLSRGSVISSTIENIAAPVYQYVNGELHVNFNVSVEVYGYSVLDISGKLLFEKSMQSKKMQRMTIPVDQQHVNIVQLKTSEGTISRKFLFSK